MRKIAYLAALASWAAIAAPAIAQDHSSHGDHAEEGGVPDAHGTMDHAGMDHGNMDHDAMDHGDMDHSMPQAAMEMPGDAAPMDHSMHHGHAPDASGDPADQPGDALPPPVPTDHAADAVFSAEVMSRSREHLYGDMRFATFSAGLDMLEYRLRDGKDGYAFEGAAWYGGDIDRAVVSIEGEGTFGEAAETVELSAYWRHAIDPWFNLQLGVRHDFRPDPQRTYAMAGIEGLAPYWIETQVQAFISDQGDIHLRADAAYDQRITQRLVLEPEIELDLALQDVPELGIGSGFDKLELSARLRYEIARNFAPYLGVSWERKLGKSADFALDEGEDPSVLALIGGVRFWF